MRYSNEIISYIENLAENNSMTETLDKVNKYFPGLNMTLLKLNEIKEKYNIKFKEQKSGPYIRDMFRGTTQFTEAEVSFAKTLIKDNHISSYRSLVGLLNDLNVAYNGTPLKYNTFCRKINLDKKAKAELDAALIRLNKPEIEIITNYLKDHTVPECVKMLKEEYGYITRDQNIYYMCKRNNIPFKRSCYNRNHVFSIGINDEVVDYIKNEATGYKSINELYLDVVNKFGTNAKNGLNMSAETFRRRISGLGLLDNVKETALKNRVIYKDDTDKSTKVKTRKSKKVTKNKKSNTKIYTDEVIDYMKSISETHTLPEAVELFKSKYPKVNWTKKGLYLASYRFGIKFKQKSSFEKGMNDFKFTDEQIKFITDILPKYNKIIDVQKELRKHFVIKASAPVVNVKIKELKNNYQFTDTDNKLILESVVDTSLSNCNQVVSDVESNTYKDIINEVDKTFNHKCKQLEISSDVEVHTEEIRNALNTLIKYATEANNILRLCNDHEDILEQYNRDVEHAIELTDPTYNDTYLQNKIRAIRKKRRNVKYIRNDIENLKPILDVINHNMPKFTSVIKQLNADLNRRKESRYVPLVDIDMISKYDWCFQGSIISKRVNTPILTTNTEIDRNYIKSLPWFRVKAEYIGYGNNIPFYNVHYDVKAVDEEDAINKSKRYFENIKSKHPGSSYTIQDAHIINR